jgi:ornithine cyclodeaminase
LAHGSVLSTRRSSDAGCLAKRMSSADHNPPLLSAPRILTLRDLQPHLDRQSVRECVKLGLIAHSKGQVVAPLPAQLLFDQPPGDCHIKYGYSRGGRHFLIKVATGFYDNPALGLPANSGLVLVHSTRTGFPEALIFDEGWLTSWRTAAAGSLASIALCDPDVEVIGIVGTGHQAELQAIWLADLLPGRPFMIWGRTFNKAAMLADRLQSLGLVARASDTIQGLLRSSRLVITATNAASALISVEDVAPGTHLTALGADSPGKQELDSRLLASAAVIATDDHKQCLHHGEFGATVRAGLVAEDADVALGAILSGEHPGRAALDDITVADLTGIAAEDIAIASYFLQRFDTVSAETGS